VDRHTAILGPRHRQCCVTAFVLDDARATHASDRQWPGRGIARGKRRSDRSIVCIESIIRVTRFFGRRSGVIAEHNRIIVIANEHWDTFGQRDTVGFVR